MLKKRFAYSYEDYEDNDKTAETMTADILADPEFAQAGSIEIGSWGNAWEESCQAIIDGIVANKAAFAHVEELAIGIMDFEDCEISWIIQGDYSGLWQALPNLKHLTIQGSTGLVLGDIEHAGLESLEIICGGLPMDVIKSIARAKLPNLRKLVLYLGVDNYGFDGSVEEIRAALAEMDLPKLAYLGLLDSELQDELVPVALACPLAKQLTTLDLSCGTLTDKGGALLLEGVAALPKLQKLDLHHHFLSDEMMAKLGALPITVDVSEQNTPDEYGGELYYYALITE